MGRHPVPSGLRRDWGTDQDGCSILHVDMDAFYASVELARRPELKGRPVIVGGAARSVVLAASYGARAFGVHSAMPMTQARRMCPQAAVVPPDHAAYHEVSGAVMALLGEVTVLVEQVSIDEAFLDVSGARRRLGPPTRIAELIRARVRRDHGVTCSVGIAATKFVAKLASGLAKPDGVLLVPRDATVPFLHALPVSSLWGVGDRTGEALARWGITTVAQLAEADVDTVQRAVGRVAGAHLHDLAWGRDPRPVTPEHLDKSVGAETTFDADTTDLTAIEAHVLAMADRCAGHLRSKGLVGRTVSLKIKTADFQTLTRSRTFAVPTDVARDLFVAARELLVGTDLGGRAVRLVGVRMEGLTPIETRQLTLEEAVADSATASSRVSCRVSIGVRPSIRTPTRRTARPARSVPTNSSRAATNRSRATSVGTAKVRERVRVWKSAVLILRLMARPTRPLDRRWPAQRSAIARTCTSIAARSVVSASNVVSAPTLLSRCSGVTGRGSRPHARSCRWAPATRPTARCTVSTSASASCATVVMPQRASASPVRSPTPHSELTGRACRKGTVASRGTSRTPSGLARPEASFATNLVAAIPTEQVTP